MQHAVTIFARCFLCLFAGVISAAEISSTPSFPLQVELRVPFFPTAFPSADSTNVAYELYLTNFSGKEVALHRIEIFDPDSKAAAPILALEGESLKSQLQHIGNQESDDLKVSPGATAVTFVWISLPRVTPMPTRLRHRLVTNDSSVEGATISTHNTQLHVLNAPVQGTNWIAADAPSNDPDNHHWRGILVVDGEATIDRRYAIDWKQVQDGKSFTGDAADKRSYYSFSQPVFAVANGTVVLARDGLPDNVPGHGSAFHPAVPITLGTLPGNTVVIDLGGGQFAHYFHLERGSVRVKAGDHLKRGQMLAQVGCSGDAREPHLHFEVTTSAKQLGGEGVPYVLNRYIVQTEGGVSQVRTRELPLSGMHVSFGRIEAH